MFPKCRRQRGRRLSALRRRRATGRILLFQAEGMFIAVGTVRAKSLFLIAFQLRMIILLRQVYGGGGFRGVRDWGYTEYAAQADYNRCG